MHACMHTHVHASTYAGGCIILITLSYDYCAGRGVVRASAMMHIFPKEKRPVYTAKVSSSQEETCVLRRARCCSCPQAAHMECETSQTPWRFLQITSTPPICELWVGVVCVCGCACACLILSLSRARARSRSLARALSLSLSLCMSVSVPFSLSLSLSLSLFFSLLEWPGGWMLTHDMCDCVCLWVCLWEDADA